MNNTAKRHGNWFQTFTGKAFWILDPRPEEIEIEDIAHALSNICRFGGHVREFYCPTEDQRILTSDLRWVPAGEIEVGQRLLGFDEYATEIGAAGKPRRRFRPSIVTCAQRRWTDVIRLEMEDGSTACTSREHPWLVATKQSRNQEWMTAGFIAADLELGRKRYMHRFMTPWTTELGYRAGWLAGMFDGEGHFSYQNRGGLLLGVSQKPGKTCDRIADAPLEFGIGFSTQNSGAGTHTHVVRGGYRGILSALGRLRPLRLLEKLTDAVEGGGFAKSLNGVGYPSRIVKAYRERRQWVCGLETSTHTYFCEGFGAHNSVAQHSVLVSQLVPPAVALQALLHDASEAFMGDMVNPLKKHMPDFKAAEVVLENVIAERFNLPTRMDPRVKRADLIALATERRDLMQAPPMPWNIDELGYEPHPSKIVALPPHIAETLFMSTFLAILDNKLHAQPQQ